MLYVWQNKQIRLEMIELMWILFMRRHLVFSKYIFKSFLLATRKDFTLTLDFLIKAGYNICSELHSRV